MLAQTARLCSEKPGARFTRVGALQKGIALAKALAIGLRNADGLRSSLLQRPEHRGTGQRIKIYRARVRLPFDVECRCGR